MKALFIQILMVMLLLPVQAQKKIEKSDLRVLYVGQNPDTPDRYGFGGGDAWKEIRKERANIFHEFFQQYFNQVTLVYGEDYNERLTDNNDVVIFDAVPRQLDGVLPEMAWGNEKFISEDYDKPTIFIAGVVGPIFHEKKSKIEVLCNCLDSHAYYFDENHPVFSLPYKVPLNADTEIRKPNPSVYNYYSGRNLPEKMPMVLMQDVDLKSYPPGIVALPGFDDSPDAEVISCGPSIKMVEAVSIGRHGNYFQWGYRADPRHLTESGKLALINSIHYIAKFNGQKPFVKRLEQSKSLALDFMYRASDKGYATEVDKKLQAHDKYNSAKIRERIGNLSEYDKFLVKFEPKLPSRAFYLKSVPNEIIKELGDDWNAYLKYYEDNQGYLGLRKEITDEKSDAFIKLIFDKDLQKLGVANNDIQLLEKCITMLEANDQTELAQKLLLRYTQELFTSAKQWRKWFKKNKKKLFFTEVGGYKWMLNPM